MCFLARKGIGANGVVKNNELVARLIHGANHAMLIYEKMWDVNPKIQRWCKKWREARGAFAMLVTDLDDRPDYSADTSAIDALIAEAAGDGRADL